MDVNLKAHARRLTDFAKIEVTIEQTWPFERQKVDNQVQTARIRTGNAESQAYVQHQSVSTQTNDAAQGAAASQNDDIALQKCLPHMASVLEEALQEPYSQSLDYFADCLDSLDDAHSDAIFELRPSTETPWLSSLVITGLSWNATGLVLAASYGRKDLLGWCLYPGALCTWKVDHTIQVFREPALTIEVDSCLMCIAFHPKHSNLIAGGTYNGQVYVWDLSKDDPQQAVSLICNASHVDPVMQIAWHSAMLNGSKHVVGNEVFHIVTVSTDGRVLIWSMGDMRRPIYGYELLYPRSQTAELVEWGGTCMSFSSREDHGTFVVGTEGGTLYKCLLQFTAQNIQDFDRQSGTHGEPWRTVGVKMTSPIKTEYESHIGPVHAVNFSPFHRHIFISCGFDGFMGLYNTLQVRPILRLEPSEGSYVLCAQWSPFRPLVLAAGTGDGCLFVYDLQINRLHPQHAIRVTENGQPLNSLAFNNHFSRYIAASDGVNVKMYLLGLGLTKERETERKELACLAELSADDYDL